MQLEMQSMGNKEKGGWKMSVFIVDTHVVKPEKQVEYTSLMQRLRKYMKENPKDVQRIEIMENLCSNVWWHRWWVCPIVGV